MEDNYIMVEGETEQTYKFAFFDCAENFYKEIFRKRGLMALVTGVLTKVNEKYKVVICDVEKGDAVLFCRAMTDLYDEMIRRGYDDYPFYTREFFSLAAVSEKEIS